MMEVQQDQSFASSGSEETIYVAAGKDYNTEKHNLLWVLQEFPGPIGLLHVHWPSKLISFMGARVPEKLANAKEKELHRKREKEKMFKLLRSYARLCSGREVRIQYITREDTLLGLQQLVLMNQARRLVIASRSMSKDNALLQFCQIMLVRNGRHEWTSPATPQWTPAELTGESQGYMTPPSELEEESIEQYDIDNREEDGPIPSGNAPSDSDEDSTDKFQDDSQLLMEETPREDQDGCQILEEENPNHSGDYEDSFRAQGTAEYLDKDDSFNETSQLEFFKAKVKELERKLHSLEEASNPRAKQPAPKSVYKNSIIRQEYYGQGPAKIIEFSMHELKKATKYFHCSNKIGQGGYGPVYRGKLRGSQVAIKMLNKNGRQSHFEFEQEVLILSYVRHPNIVKLIGVCLESMALVYEYLSNGNLERSLRAFAWQVRVRIIKELHSALLYLHSNMPYAIVHSDIKLANLLLDENNVLRLGDFGTARLLRQDLSGRGNIRRMTMPMGTTGYIDPIYFQTQTLSPGADTYSFGIVILQLLTGWEVIDIPDKVEKRLRNGEAQEILDVNAGNWPYPQTEQLLRVALMCCNCDKPNRRPNLNSDCWRALDILNAIAGKSKEQKDKTTQKREAQQDLNGLEIVAI